MRPSAQQRHLKSSMETKLGIQMIKKSTDCYKNFAKEKYSIELTENIIQCFEDLGSPWKE